MKRYLKHFDLSFDFVRSSIYDCLNGTTSGRNRWKRVDTSMFIADYIIKKMVQEGKNPPEIHQFAGKIRKIAKEDKTILNKYVDYIAYQMYLEIKNRRISIMPIRYEDRYDKVAKKVRKIGISSMKQQCFDYIAVNACKKMFLSKIGYYQCASLSKKGQVYGKNAIETWIRTNPKSCKYIFKCDIKKFYPSVDHFLLKQHLKRDIANEDVLYLIFKLIDSYDIGLCIGSYLSQFLANYYLSYAYHYVTEKIYKIRRNKRDNLIKHTLFYMDDIILFGSCKKDVKKASKLLEKYLKEELGLNLKQNYQLFPLDSRPIDMMGYKIYTYKTTVRKRIFNNANKVFLKAKRDIENISLEDAHKIISYNGYFMHSSSDKYYKKIKLNKSLKRAKEVISNASKSKI